jgi:phosphatidate cytidylyltransferase
MLVTFLGLQEYTRMMLPHRPESVRLLSLAGAFLPLTVLANHPLALPGGVSLLFLATALYFLFYYGEIERAATEWALAAAGIFYVPLLLVHILLLRTLLHGIDWVFLLLFIVMFSDTFAYYIGCRFGRRRLYPSVSPKKSVEGALGGLLGALSGTLVAHFTFFPQLTLVDCLLTALAAGIMGQLGDLFESLLKRSAGVKDSGSIIPGHGGILDRLDSILFAAPVLYYYAVYVFYGRTGF